MKNYISYAFLYLIIGFPPSSNTFDLHCLHASLCHSAALWCRTGSAKQLTPNYRNYSAAAFSSASQCNGCQCCRSAASEGLHSISMLSLSKVHNKHFSISLRVFHSLGFQLNGCINGKNVYHTKPHVCVWPLVQRTLMPWCNRVKHIQQYGDLPI